MKVECHVESVAHAAIETIAIGFTDDTARPGAVYTGIYILKCDASVRLCAPQSERALTLYTQRQTALLRPIYPVSAVVGS